MARCAFGSVPVNDVLEARSPFGTDLEGRFLYVADGDRQWLLAAFDFLTMWRRTCLDWRRRISDATGIPRASIWVHITQVHSGPGAIFLDGAPCRKLAEISLPVIQRMMEDAEQADIAHVTADLEGRFNFNREVFAPDLGTITAWGGEPKTEKPGALPHFDDAETLHLLDYKPDLPAFRDRVYFDRPADPLAALLVFRSRSGEVLGTLTRFTGHPDIAASGTGLGARPDQRRYNWCWPGYVRQMMERELGGIGLCLNGPCGNVGMRYTACQTAAEADALARWFGEGIAGGCLESWRSKAPAFAPARLGAVRTSEVDLPLRSGIPTSRAETPSPEQCREIANEMQVEFKAAKERGDSPMHIKRLAEEILFTIVTHNLVKKWADLSDEELRRRAMRVELTVARLNDLIFAGFPGETMTETGMLVRAQTLGEHAITVDNVNGHCTYMANDSAHSEGGYSYWCSLLARGAEPLMRRRVVDLLRSVYG